MLRRGHVLPIAPTSFKSLFSAAGCVVSTYFGILTVNSCALLFSHRGHVVILFEGTHSI
jgi:hypothetical protein